MLSPWEWRFEDWVNPAVLGLGAVLRVAFLMGIGFPKHETEAEKKKAERAQRFGLRE